MPHRAHILLVDQDRAHRRALADQLITHGRFRILEADTAAEATRHARSRHLRIQAIVSEMTLPDCEGPDFCARLRTSGVHLPVLFLSAAHAEADVVRALNAGANDYLRKPCRPAELTARLRAQIRHHSTSEEALLAIGAYEFHPGTRTLHDHGGNTRIRFTNKEAAVLKYLIAADGEPVTGRVLLSEVWGYSPTTATHTVGGTIYRLRRKLGALPDGDDILTSEAAGYRLRAAPQPA